MVITRIRNIAEHAVVPDGDDPLRNTRTTRANWIERALIAPYFVNYHLEHHLLYYVPCYNLPKLHAIMMRGPHAALPARVEPRDLHPVGVRDAHERLDDVVEDRPSAHLRQLLDVREVVRAVGGGERRLHEPLVPLAEDAREPECRLVVHDVGHHRAAVVVALHGPRAVGVEALRRPAAAARVHRLVEKPAELVVLGVGRQDAGLGALEAEHPDEERRDRNVRQDVHRLRRPIDAVQELRIRDPVPRQAALHRLVGDRLDARHGQHRARRWTMRPGGRAS